MACRVLIADDVADMRRLVRLWLDPSKFEVVGEAADGAEAVELARSEQPDAIIMDLSMPVMDGLEAIKQIRSDAPDAKILVLSGFTGASASKQALALGAHAYLEKGVSFDELTDVLTELCAS
jgi:DNA-binding NarL/FixJ family response regulator